MAIRFRHISCYETYLPPLQVNPDLSTVSFSIALSSWHMCFYSLHPSHIFKISLEFSNRRLRTTRKSWRYMSNILLYRPLFATILFCVHNWILIQLCHTNMIGVVHCIFRPFFFVSSHDFVLYVTLSVLPWLRMMESRDPYVTQTVHVLYNVTSK